MILDILVHFVSFFQVSFAIAVTHYISWRTGRPGNALGLLPQLVVAANMTRLSLSLAGASFLLVGLISLASVPVLRRGNWRQLCPYHAIVMP